MKDQNLTKLRLHPLNQVAITHLLALGRLGTSPDLLPVLQLAIVAAEDEGDLLDRVRAYQDLQCPELMDDMQSALTLELGTPILPILKRMTPTEMGEAILSVL